MPTTLKGESSELAELSALQQKKADLYAQLAEVRRQIEEIDAHLEPLEAIWVHMSRPKANPTYIPYSELRSPRGELKRALQKMLKAGKDGLERCEVVAELKRRQLSTASVSQYLNRFAKKNKQGRWVWKT